MNITMIGRATRFNIIIYYYLFLLFSSILVSGKKIASNSWSNP